MESILPNCVLILMNCVWRGSLRRVFHQNRQLPTIRNSIFMKEGDRERKKKKNKKYSHFCFVNFDHQTQSMHLWNCESQLHCPNHQIHPKKLLGFYFSIVSNDESPLLSSIFERIETSPSSPFVRTDSLCMDKKSSSSSSSSSDDEYSTLACLFNLLILMMECGFELYSQREMSHQANQECKEKGGIE